jgi:NAD-dependent deacetylase
MANDDVVRIAEWLTQSRRTVAFTGAGISTESGIPDFRSPGGVWAQNTPVYFNEFLDSGKKRYEYWRQKSIAHADYRNAEPNMAHRILAEWESAGKLMGVVTQNIDGLHQRAGSQQVWELHGTAREVGCLSCERRWDADRWVRQFLETDEVPLCPDCGGLLKHATVSFGQALPESVLESAVEASQHADLFLALGSSLVVHPAAGLPELAANRGAKLVIINREETPLDYLADAVIRAPLGETLSQIHIAAQELKES